MQVRQVLIGLNDMRHTPEYGSDEHVISDESTNRHLWTAAQCAAASLRFYRLPAGHSERPAGFFPSSDSSSTAQNSG